MIWYDRYIYIYIILYYIPKHQDMRAHRRPERVLLYSTIAYYIIVD